MFDIVERDRNYGMGETPFHLFVIGFVIATIYIIIMSLKIVWGYE
jgi:hypothetical protein